MRDEAFGSILYFAYFAYKQMINSESESSGAECFIRISKTEETMVVL